MILKTRNSLVNIEWYWKHEPVLLKWYRKKDCKQSLNDIENVLVNSHVYHWMISKKKKDCKQSCLLLNDIQKKIVKSMVMFTIGWYWKHACYQWMLNIEWKWKYACKQSCLIIEWYWNDSHARKKDSKHSHLIIEWYWKYAFKQSCLPLNDIEKKIVNSHVYHLMILKTCL